MDFDDLLSFSDTLEHIKCAVCKNYLSYFPIYTTEKNENICGRCPLPSNSVSRNQAFEAVTRFARFPCRWCGSREMLQDMSEHEDSCPFKIIRCPTECEWEGIYSGMLEHCHEKHSETIIKNNEFKIALAHSQQNENLLEFNEMVVVFSNEFDADTKVFRWSVHHIEDEINSKKYSYRLILSQDKRTLSEEGPIAVFNEMKFNEISLDLFKTGVDVNCKIDIKSEEPKFKLEMLTLDCCLCFPPLIPTPNEGGVCLDCISGIDEDLIWINVSCSNRKRGCKLEFSKFEYMKEHKSVCRYSN